MGKTLAEKILSQKSGKDVVPGDIVTVPVDFVFGQDGTMPLAIEQMEKELGTRKVFDPKKVGAVCDHASPSPSEQVSNVHIFMRKFARENGIHFFENGDGICHQIVAEKFAAPGKIVIGADSHTCAHGASGGFCDRHGLHRRGKVVVEHQMAPLGLGRCACAQPAPASTQVLLSNRMFP